MVRVRGREGAALLACHRDFWLVMLAYGLMTGVQGGWAAIYALIISRLGGAVASDPQTTAAWPVPCALFVALAHTLNVARALCCPHVVPTTSGWPRLGFWSAVGANFTAMFFAAVSDRLEPHWKRLLLVALSMVGALLYCAFTLVFLEPRWLQAGGLPLVYVLCIVGNMATMGTVPLFYELAVDAVYPVAEGLSTSVLTAANNVGCGVFLLLPMIGVPISNWVNYLMVAACMVSAACMLAFRADLGRTADDLRSDSDADELESPCD